MLYSLSPTIWGVSTQGEISLGGCGQKRHNQWGLIALSSSFPGYSDESLLCNKWQGDVERNWAVVRCEAPKKYEEEG